MVGLLRRKKEEESDAALLAPVPKKRGLFRRSVGEERRSDNPGQTKTGLSSAAHWGKVRAPATPPITPPTEFDRYSTPVSSVTLVKGSGSSTPRKGIHLPKGKNTKAREAAAGRTQDMDDRSEYSDLTDNRTLQRLNEQKVAYEQAMREKKQRDKYAHETTSTSSNPATILKEKTLRNPDDPTASVSVGPPDPPEGGFLTDLLGMMDKACTSSAEPKKIENVASFAPEWGVAPTFEEADGKVNRAKEDGDETKQEPAGNCVTRTTPDSICSPNTAVDGDTMVETDGGETSTREDTYGGRTDDDTDEKGDTDFESQTTPDTDKQTEHTDTASVASPRSVRTTHENFEMVLEELKEKSPSPKQRRSWNPFLGRGRKNSQTNHAATAAVMQEAPSQNIETVEPKVHETAKATPPRSNKAHQDMVKQALFPDLVAAEAKQAAGPTQEEQPKKGRGRSLSPSKRTMKQTAAAGPKKTALPPKPPAASKNASTEQAAKSVPTKNQRAASPPKRSRGASPPKKQRQQQQEAVQPVKRSQNSVEYIEEKKEEDEVEEPGLEVVPKPEAKPRPAAKKGLFRSFRRRGTQKAAPTLEPVEEDKPSTPKEIRLTAGGARPDPRRASRHAGVGDKVVEDIYKDLYASEQDEEKDRDSLASSEYDRSSEAVSSEPRHSAQDSASSGDRLTPAQKPTEQDTGFVGGIVQMITETVAAVQTGGPAPGEAKKGSEKQPRKSSTWKDEGDEEEHEKMVAERERKMQEEKKSGGDVESHPDPGLRRTKSAPKKVGNGQFKRRKQVWKEVKDESSGRSYYYHRITRQTTWTRPKEMDTPVDKENANPQGSNQQPETEEPTTRKKQQPISRQRSKSVETKNRLENARQSRAAAATEDDVVRKSSPRDFDRKVWQQKQEIAEILQSMAPPDGTSIESLMAQYEGRESELLQHVRRMKESRPFDEPLGAEDEDDVDDKEGEDMVHDLNETMTTRGSSLPSFHNSSHNSFSQQSLNRTQSGITSKQSESTQQMANTKNRPRPYEGSVSTSLSSRGNQVYQPAPKVSRVPSKIPAPSRVRSRELMVEELSSDRFRTENYNNHEVRQQEAVSVRRRPFTTPFNPTPIQEEEHDELSSQANDTVSALSVNELEFARPPNQVDDARRRALDDAIRREDWDMAAAISDGLRAVNSKQNTSSGRQDPGEWKQSELDRFISENDWQAVSEYIAHLRSSKNTDGSRSKSQSPETSEGSGGNGGGASSRPRTNIKRRDSDDDYNDVRNSNRDDQRKGTSGKKKYSSRLRQKGRPSALRARSFSSDETTSDGYSDYYSSESSSSAPRRRSRHSSSSRRNRGGGSGKRRSGASDKREFHC